MPAPRLVRREQQSNIDAQAWELISQHLLEEVVKSTGSNFAILRKLESDGNLVLERFAPHSPQQQIRPLERDEFEIPQRKEPSCWDSQDPTRTWGVVTYTSPDDHIEHLDYPPGERKFILWVGQKAWFPIALTNGNVGVMILVRGPLSRSYTTSDIARTWVAAQSYLSSELDDPYQAGFVQALDALNLVRIARDEHHFIRAVTHSLASQYGLRWNRVWLLEENPAASGQFACRFCLGGIQPMQWLKAVERWKSTGFASLDAEVRAGLMGTSEEDDQLLDSCGDGRLVFALERDECARLFDAAVSTEKQKCFRFASPLTKDLDAVGQRFRAAVEAAVAAAFPGETFNPAPTTFAFGLECNEKRFLVAFSQPYSQSHEHPSLVLTTAYLQHVARVLSEWQASLAALEEGER